MWYFQKLEMFFASLIFPIIKTSLDILIIKEVDKKVTQERDFNEEISLAVYFSFDSLKGTKGYVGLFHNREIAKIKKLSQFLERATQ